MASEAEEAGETVLLVFDDFDDGESEALWTGRDDLLDAEVVDGELHMKVVDTSRFQTLRSTWPPLTAITFEADFVISSHSVGLYSAGCWSGDDSYALAMTGDGSLAVISRTGSKSPSDAENPSGIATLAELGRSSLVSPVGVPFHL